MRDGVARLAARATGALALAFATVGCAGSPFRSLSAQGCNPLPLRVEQDLLLVDVHVGDAAIAVIVDTGSSLSLTLRPQELERVGARFDGRTRTFRDARGALLTARGAIVPEVRLGAAVFRDVAVWESVHSDGWSPPVDAGHLGRGLLAALRVTVDVPAGTLSLDGPGCPLPAGTPHPFEVTANGWVTRAEVAGREVELVWDTAATSSILVSNDAPADATREPTAVVVAPGVTGRFATMALDGLPVDGLVGAEVFRQRAFTFDETRSRLVIGSPASTR